jgi:thiosulfate reductase cytochrome b subunit
MAGEPADGETGRVLPRAIFRHRLSTRLWHWWNAVIVVVMLMSGLMIFNAHPHLYWGRYGANMDRAWLEIGSTATQGVLRIGPVAVPTTGVLGRWTDHNGNISTRAFPGWATIPTDYSLSAARRWHLAFAWLLVVPGLIYGLWSLANRHVQRDLAPTREELRARHIWHDIKDHARLRLPTGEAATRYNILQKLAYIAVLFLLLPLVIVTGWAMSPGLNATWPWLLDLLGGRQSARSIHFLCMAGIAGFILVHVVMVVLAGPVNEVRSMITGWYRVPRTRNRRTRTDAA